MKLTSIAVLALFSLGAVIALMLAGTNPQYIPEQQAAVMWLRQAAGTFIAVVAAMAILIGSLNGKRIEDLLALVVALWAGLAVISSEWTLTVPMGLVVLALVIAKTVELFRRAP